MASELELREAEETIERLQSQVAELAGLLERYIHHDKAQDEMLCSSLCGSNLHRSAIAAIAKVGR